MANLSALTEPAAVELALDEFRQLGRDAFLAEYGFEGSRDYFLLYEGELFDSKAVLAAAFALSTDRRLSPVDLYGGEQTVRALTRLGFTVVTRAQLQPPQLGDEYATRTDIYDAYGGDKVPGIATLPGDLTVNVFSDAEGPYADEPPSVTEEFGYRGEGLNGVQSLTSRGNAALEAARTSKAAVRFWYKPIGRPFSFTTWVAVVGRAWVAGAGEDRVPRSEIEWRLQAVPAPSNVGWPRGLQEALAEADAFAEEGPIGPEAVPGSSYASLLQRVESRGSVRRSSGALRTDYVRSAAARAAVLVRAGGLCEGPRCTGMPAELNRRGEPILDVDHIRDLALGGTDHPANMAALCPNCHAVKTRGTNAARWRSELLRIAASRHHAALSA